MAKRKIAVKQKTKAATSNDSLRFLTVYTKEKEVTGDFRIFPSLGEAKTVPIVKNEDKAIDALKTPDWPAPGSEDTELGVLMEPEVDHGKAEVYARVQA